MQPPEVTIQAKLVRRQTGLKQQYLYDDGKLYTVEVFVLCATKTLNFLAQEIALLHYAAADGWLGIHTENGVHYFPPFPSSISHYIRFGARSFLC